MSSNYQAASPTFTQVAGYTSSTMGYTLTASDGLVGGTMYAFRLVAVNVKGSSEYSEELIIAAAAPIAKPAAPTRSLAYSNNTSLRIEWAESGATQIEVSGYVLYMSEGLAGNFDPIYNGSLNALKRDFDASNLTTGQLYQFKVVAVNYNGPSEASDPLSVHACVAPSAPGAPTRVTGDKTSITLTWATPSNDGGCPITGYQLMRDSGGGLTDPVAIEVDAASIAGRPALIEHKVQFTTSDTGKPFRYQLIAHNAESSSWSALARHVLAGPPDKPSGSLAFQYAETPYLTIN